jgi:hypothetical protein
MICNNKKWTIATKVAYTIANSKEGLNSKQKTQQEKRLNKK